MASDIKTIIEAVEIPSIPHVLHQILSLADNPRTTSSQLEKIVTQEPALASQLLKWVNSALYSLPHRISSIGHSMIILGFSTVKSVASGMLLINVFDTVEGLSKDYLLQVWGHTLRSAGISKILTKSEPMQLKDDIYLACMIHDVGHIVMAQYFQNDYSKLTVENPFVPIEIEKEAFGVDHAQLGKALLEEWRFPEKVAELVGFHHCLDQEGYQKELNYMNLSETIALKHSELKDFLSQEEAEVDPSFIESLNLLKWTWKNLCKQHDDIQSMFDSIGLLLKK